MGRTATCALCWAENVLGWEIKRAMQLVADLSRGHQVSVSQAVRSVPIPSNDKVTNERLRSHLYSAQVHNYTQCNLAPQACILTSAAILTEPAMRENERDIVLCFHLYLFICFYNANVLYYCCIANGVHWNSVQLNFSVTIAVTHNIELLQKYGTVQY